MHGGSHRKRRVQTDMAGLESLEMINVVNIKPQVDCFVFTVGHCARFRVPVRQRAGSDAHFESAAHVNRHRSRPHLFLPVPGRRAHSKVLNENRPWSPRKWHGLLKGCVGLCVMALA